MPRTPVTRARSTGISVRRPALAAPGTLAASDLILLDVDQEHVGTAALRCNEKLARRLDCERADAEHEEAAEADREQDHARLVAGAARAR